MLVHFPKSNRTRWFEKSTNVCLVVRNGSRDPQWCGARWRFKCEGCDIVQSDHAPQAGVAQGIFNGDLIRRRDGHQVELEEELE